MPIGTHAHVSSQTMMWATNEVNMLRTLGVNANLFLMRDVPLARARDTIVDTALSEGWDYIFFIDSDVVPPPGIVYMMLLLRAPLMCLPYPLKIGVLSIYFFDEAAKMVKPLTPDQLRSMQRANLRFGVADACGLGAALIDTYIFKRMRYPWFRFESEETLRQTLDKLRVEYNEDVYFFLKAKRELGIRVLFLTTPAYHEILDGVSLDPYDPTRIVIPMTRLDFVPLLQQMEKKEKEQEKR